MIGKSPRPQSRSSGASKSRPSPMGGAASGYSGTPHPVDMSGRKDKAPPRRTAKAEIKGYLSKVAREDRETEKAQYKNLERAMRGTESKAIAQDLKAAREDRNKPGRIVVRASGGKNPGANLKPMAKKAGGGMVKGYKDGGCVMSGRGGKYKGEM